MSADSYAMGKRVRALVEDALADSTADLRGAGLSLLGSLVDPPHLELALFDHKAQRVFILAWDVLRLAEEFVPSDDATVAGEIAYGVLAAPDRGAMAEQDGLLRWSWSDDQR